MDSYGDALGAVVSPESDWVPCIHPGMCHFAPKSLEVAITASEQSVSKFVGVIVVELPEQGMWQQNGLIDLFGAGMCAPDP